MTGIAVQDIASCLRRHTQADPNLPMRKKTRGSESTRGAHVRGEPPNAHHVRHERGRTHEGARRQGDVTVLTLLPPNRPALGKADPQNHISVNLAPPSGRTPPLSN